MTDLFNTGVIPIINQHIDDEAKKVRDYGDYWSASSAGYCMRLNIFRRLGVPAVPEIEDKKATTQRVFSAGHIFHSWIQGLTKEAGISIAQEMELQDEDLMVRGHFDDLVLMEDFEMPENARERARLLPTPESYFEKTHLILYDYKTAHSASFNYVKNREMGHYHTYQLATYMYMLRNNAQNKNILPTHDDTLTPFNLESLTEARILSISKDDLRLHEEQLMWSEDLEKKVTDYWTTLNKYWAEKKLPPCTCLDYDGGFMGKRSSKKKVYNDYFYNDEPCSLDWYNEMKSKGLVKV